MKPFKGAVPLAKWTLRFALLAFLLAAYLSAFLTFNFNSLDFWEAALFIVFGSLLFIGGFMSKPGLTVISGLIIFIASIVKIVMIYEGDITADIVLFLMPMAIGFYFFARGNMG